MKIAIQLILAMTILVSCGGKDSNSPTPPKEEAEKELGAFALTFPDNNLICTEGEENAEGGIDIEFLWTASANATSYDLELINQETNTTDTRTVNGTSVVISLPKGTQFTWQITAKLNSKTLKSDSWNFYSQGTVTENYAPFPAVIEVEDQGNSTVAISWIAEDLDDDLTSYDVSIETTQNQEVLLEDTTLTTTNFTYTNGEVYIVKVISKDSNGNTSTNELTFSF
ncbi:hypothetical protein SAMN04488009_0813 [Maribacter sedimenticola]|uniref:Fibronectin type-III domain-containing protein n=1 Tax=Maribacter sedimenticola TaxID=228956 RepID=A0ABY1SDF3_9FLAO|nr:hypothetical protein [Maribacter sedimenticola]SNR28616.1 hypothetical protein SAMN04488009_0813 [Maribacter sedimenticola]